MKVTPEEVWEKIIRNKEFLRLHEPIRLAMKPYILALPEILADDLDRPVNLGTFFGAKAALLRYELQHGFVKNITAAIPRDKLGPFTRIEFRIMLQEATGDLEKIFSDIAADPEDFLYFQGIKEEVIMLNPSTGFNWRTRKAYLERTLTVGQLLAIQPMAIVKQAQLTID